MLETVNYIPKSEVKNIVIFFHGYGSNGKDFSSLIYEYSKYLKNTAFYCPNAPKIIDYHFADAYEWFPLDNYNPQSLESNIDQMKYIFSEFTSLAENSRLLINELIEKVKNEHNVPYNKISLLGFSQGGLMATLTSLLHHEELGPIVSFSGISPVIKYDVDIKNKPKILLIHGDADNVVPVTAIDISKKILENFKIIPEIFISHNMQHEIDLLSEKKALEFLTKNL